MTNRRQPFIKNLLQILSTHPGPIACLVNYVSVSLTLIKFFKEVKAVSAIATQLQYNQ